MTAFTPLAQALSWVLRGMPPDHTTPPTPALPATAPPGTALPATAPLATTPPAPVLPAAAPPAAALPATRPPTLAPSASAPSAAALPAAALPASGLPATVLPATALPDAAPNRDTPVTQAPIRAAPPFRWRWPRGPGWLAAVAFALIAAGCSAQRGIPFAGIVAFGLTGAVLSAVLGAVAQPAAGYPWALAGAALAGAALGVAGGWASHDALLAMVVAFGAAGGLVGAVGRLVLRRLGIACRAPWCELAGGVLSAVVGWRAAAGLLGWSWLAVPLLLGWLAVPLAVADINCRRLPNVLTLTAGPVLGLAVVIGEPSAALRAAAGVAVFGGAHAVVRAVAPAAMGGGDVKLAAGLGVVLGALGWADVALAATLAATGTLLLAVVTRSRTAPHGPGLLGATWLLAAVSHLG